MEQKIGFKGFDENLKCRGFQYEEGMTYEMSESSISLCNRGFHFCYRIKDVFSFYSKNDKNKFAIVKPEGKILKGSDKSVCSRIKVVKVLSPQDLEKILFIEDKERLEKDVFVLDVVRDLHRKFNLSVGGSVSLFLQGLALNRTSGSVDLDIVLPYYQNLIISDDQNEGLECIEEIETFGGKSSGNDFSETYGLSTTDGRFVKLDVRVKPEQKYEICEYDGFKYKVCDIFTILEAKLRYAMEGDKKHREDIHHLLGFNQKKNSSRSSSDMKKDISELFDWI